MLASIVGVAIVLFHFRGVSAARWTAGIGGGVLLVLLTLELAQAPGERFFTLKDDLGSKAGRLTVWHDARSLVAARPLLGWGFGTFESAFPTVQSADIDMRYDHAHNDWLEWIIEGGLLSLVAALALFGFALRWGDTATRAALVAVALHAVWDFSLRIPAAAVATAAIMGLAYSSHGAAAATRENMRDIRRGAWR